MSRKGKIQDGNAFDSKCTAIDLRIASHIHYYPVCVELPLGMGQFAGRDGAIVDTIMVGPGLLDHFSSEIERARRSQHYTCSTEAYAGGAGYIFEAPSFTAEIVGP